MKLKQKLAQNKAAGKALLATNFYNFETLVAVLTAARNTKSEIILQVSESSIKYMGVSVVKALATSAMQQYGVKAWLHLDHGQNTTLVKECIDAGFDSVMIDASEKSFEENVKITSEITKYAEN